ncbi:MAG: thioesterase [Desulfobacteraceae bacterium]|nr:thioesterase [Desulfobacteraceae bacterium]
MSKPIWLEQFTIHTHEADANGLARLDSLFSCFQEAAGHHAIDLGVGRNHLERQGCFWVLSRCWMQIQQYPRLGQPITVRTWPRDVVRLFALRDVQFLSQEGELLGSGVSAWLILSQDKHRLMRPGPIMKDVAPTQEPPVAGDVLEKQAAVGNLSELRRFSVRYSDLDVNRHVNNAAYVRWILDSFNAERHDRSEIAAIRIDYLSETILGEHIDVLAQDLVSDGRQVIVGVRPEGAQPVFQAAVTWRDRRPVVP